MPKIYVSMWREIFRSLSLKHKKKHNPTVKKTLVPEAQGFSTQIFSTKVFEYWLPLTNFPPSFLCLKHAFISSHNDHMHQTWSPTRQHYKPRFLLYEQSQIGEASYASTFHKQQMKVNPLATSSENMAEQSCQPWFVPYRAGLFT